jgi:predicted amidohydrolase
MSARKRCLASVALVFGAAASALSGEEKQEPAAPVGKTVRIAGIVLKWVLADKEANYRRVEPLIREAAAGGAKIVCTTECFLDGYAIADKSIPLEDYRKLGEPIPDGSHFRRLTGLARELKIHLIAGLTEADGDDRYNTAIIIGPDGKLIGKYHKQHLEHELVRNKPGNESPVFATEYGKVGVMICADRRHADTVKSICTRGADFLICPSGGMSGPKDNDHILQDRSRENRKYIVFVHPKEFLVTAPDGSVVKQTMLGDKMSVAPADFQTEVDSKRVFYFDLPITREP